jgi:adenosylcobinamide-GDP ribazoletransferase
MRRLLAALAFLSRLPIPGRYEAADIGRAALVFPLAGALLGGFQLAVAMLASDHVPAPVAAVIVLAVAALTTGALHLDGLADTADGFGGGRTREDVLRIMRDHATGAYGTVAVVLLLLAKLVTLQVLIAHGAWTWLVIAPALARWAVVPLSRWLPYAREGGGLGAALTDHLGAVELIGATLLAGAAALGLGGQAGAIAWAAVAAGVILFGLVCRQRIGGVTGDTLGAAIEVAEVLVYLIGTVR